MGLRGQAIKKGDWVRAESNNGSVIVGEAGSEVYLGGTSHLLILLGDGGSSAVTINVNFWKEVSVIDTPVA